MEIKAGDRVKFVQSNWHTVGINSRGDIINTEMFGIVETVFYKNGLSCEIRIKHYDKIWQIGNFELVPNSCFKALRCLSGENIILGGACRGEIDKYVKKFMFYCDPSLEEVLKACTTNRSWLPWLMANGYIGYTPIGRDSLSKSRREELIAKKGDRYVINGQMYILGWVPCDSVDVINYCLISLETGDCWSDGVRQEYNQGYVSEKTFKKLCDCFDWEEIYKTRISKEKCCEN